jgi:uroporphyrinogen-III synthase
VAARTVHVDMRGTAMSITGNLVTVDEQSVMLSDTEAQVLALLATEPNIVHTKADILRQVWRDQSADPHVVEAAVTRMRRRLGPVGVCITAVYRRGYTLRT